MSEKYQLESLGILASSVAHDLNNILTGILGHVSILRLALKDAHGNKDSLDAIENASRRAAEMVQKILDFSKGAKSEHKVLDCIELIKSVLNLLSSSIPENVEISFHTDFAEILVEGDESQIIQLIINLVINAKDALLNKASGEILISVKKVQINKEKDAEELGIKIGQYALLTVSDNGHGIPKEIQAKIFEPFFTTKNSYGTGLGLSIVSSVVKSHRGSITLSSEEGRGSTFEILFPLCSKLEKVKASTQSKKQEVPVGTEKILVVDDEETVRIVVQRSLEHLGYEVVVVNNGIEALEVYSNNPDDFNLVIIDMIMPLMAGDELFEKLKECNPDVGVVLASGYSSDARARAILDNGGLGFIQKPFAIEELAQEVRRCLDVARKK